MLATELIFVHPAPEAKRLGAYVLAGIVGLLVCGVASIAKELREEAASARL